MRYTTEKGETFDLGGGFFLPERHILQKLLLWKEMAASVEVFRRQKAAALLAGWNNSGPIKEGRALRSVTEDLEARVARRLAGD